ncbi:MAG: thiol peroxidase [Bdellovibrionales bacterium]|nr:thiol peroxidase [Bdellovibrionales bacterium]
MAKITLKGNPIHTNGELPINGDDLAKSAAFKAPLVDRDLQSVTLDSFQGNRVILNVFPSIDTPVCAQSVRAFNKEAAQHNNVKILCISQDLPFAFKTFCGSEGIENVIPLSTFRSSEFAHALGLEIIDGPLQGLTARAVLVLDENGKVLHSELVPEIAQEPNYDAALRVL